MTTYVLGAGASVDAGYPFAKSMGSSLFAWMESHADSGCFSFRAAAKSLRENFGKGDDIEELLTKVDDFTKSTPSSDQAVVRISNDDKPALVEAIRQWFREISGCPATSYQLFAQKVLQDGDCVVTFNYDVSLDRQLQLAGLWNLGNGYGFRVEGFPMNSPIQLLKLHGSVNWLAGIFPCSR